MGGHYHHGTDDMQPCYLPDGGIAFISTRCQYGILCDSPDDFTTTVLYRIDRDGKNLRKLSNSSVSEASPVTLPDGRIMYTRREYLDQGQVTPFYQDPAISCWLPYPVKPRKTPPLTAMSTNPKLAVNNQAVCMVSDVYHGLANVKRGEAAYLRVLEQVPRPWAARRRWDGDLYDQQHACITKDTHLGLKVQHGIVPVESDGSAYFVVPAGANIFLQVLDRNYLALQTERTYVDYMPGEVRGCVGCHEVPHSASAKDIFTPRKAMKRPPSVPEPQPGEKDGRRTLDYAADVQPVWDRHCLTCHGPEKPKGNRNLKYAAQPDFRPHLTLDQARSLIDPAARR